MNRARVAMALLALIVAGIGAAWWTARRSAEDVAPRRGDAGVIVIAGGMGASLPPAAPEEQGMDATALATATVTARDLGASALGIARRGHEVHLWTTHDEDALLRSPLLSRLVLAAGEAAGVPPPVAESTPAWAARLSLEVWRPLDARDALVRLDGGTPQLPCCLWLHARDALAVAVELVEGHRRLIDAAAAARVLQAMDDGRAPRGAEPFGSRPARIWRDDEGTRLYSFPAQDLVILLVRADERRLTDETLIAHQVLRGIVDRQATPDSAPTPRDLVPAH